MSDVIDNSDDESSASEPEGPLGGERLAEARRAQQISVLEIAKELHLDEPKVRALERNEFDVLGAPVFAKGHLRKYAQLVQVDANDVMADYYQLSRASAMPPVIATRPRPRREMSPGPWIAVIVVIVVVATAYWWFTSQPVVGEPPPQESAPQESMPQESMPEEAMPEETMPASEPESLPLPERQDFEATDDDSAVLQSAADTVETPDEGPGQAPEPGEGQMQMLITYSGDCWTEISDANGRRLFFGLGTDGRTVDLSGEAPFNVLFGDAANVSIRINGVERAISAAERRGNTARLTVSGS
ncbi:MAG: RodZ domain-containing protein [Woeseiaceae bacterium]